MFDDDSDFEIDAEFLDGVFDAEKSAIQSNDGLQLSCDSPVERSNFESPTSPVKRRKISSSPTADEAPPPFGKIPGFVTRSNEDSVKLVASAVQRCSSTSNSNLGQPKGSYHHSEKRSGDQQGNLLYPTPNSASESRIFKAPNLPSSCDDPNKTQNAKSPTHHTSNLEVSFNLNTSRVRQRKFPGPAGLLPERGHNHNQGQRPNFSSLLNLSGSDLEDTEEPLSFCSQSTASVLEDGPWSALQCDLAAEGEGLLRKYTVAWVKQKAAARQLLGQKVPFLAAVLHSIDCSSPDPCVVLRDATGEIPGTLHRSVWDSFGGQLIAGSALVLRFVGVLSTGISARRHYLNITSNNIVTIYSSPLCESSFPDTPTRVRKTDVHKWTLTQLVQAASTWEEQSKRKKATSVPSIPAQQNAISCRGPSPNESGSHTPPIRPLQTTNRINNITASSSNPYSCGSASSTTFRHQAPSVHGNDNFPSSSASSNSKPLLDSQRNSHCINPLRQQNNVSIPAGGANHSRFIPKRPTLSLGAHGQSEASKAISSSSPLPPPVSSQSSVGLQSSKDLFSEDDIDISSVLDGIDSDSLFGDF